MKAEMAKKYMWQNNLRSTYCFFRQPAPFTDEVCGGGWKLYKS